MDKDQPRSPEDALRMVVVLTHACVRAWDAGDHDQRARLAYRRRDLMDDWKISKQEAVAAFNASR